jgi:hypothetical protein
MVVTRHVAEAAEALRAPYGEREILTNLDYDPVIEEWNFNWQCFKGPADAKIWALKICGWLQYKYPDGPAW